MRITGLELSRQTTKSKGLMESWSRKAVHALLSRITRGRLVLEEDGQVTEFGNAVGDSDLKAHIVVRDAAAFECVLRNGSIGAGEAFMLDYWDSPDLLQVVRLFVLNMNALDAMGQKQPMLRKVAGKLMHMFRKNTLSGSRKNISAHYDLSNQFFSHFLDNTMAYSSGIFKSEKDDLFTASENKFRHICERLQLKSNDHLLEIGTGWGGLAIYAAKHFGCKVTSTTLSHEQYCYARDWVKSEGLEDRITLLEKDYRDLPELNARFDKLVSVEMIEAVGAEFYSEYFRLCSALLKKDGLMLIQAITISDQRFEQSVGNPDFIKKYIFPGGQLPCNKVITRHIAEDTDMQLIGLEDITHDYARTLGAWRERFFANIEKIKALGTDNVFIRMWQYYLCFCEGGFQERVIHTGQFLVAKPEFRNLPRIQ